MIVRREERTSEGGEGRQGPGLRPEGTRVDAPGMIDPSGPSGQLIRVGTVIRNAASAPALIPFFLEHGFESFQLAFRGDLGSVRLGDLALACRDALGDSGAAVSALGVYGNPITEDSTREAIAAAIDGAVGFGTDVVTCFTGRVPGASIPDSIDAFALVFRDLASRAADRGVRLAFENCPQGGTWQAGDRNLAHNPAAWELLFGALGDPQHVGLEWEPCHQLCQLIEPMPQLREWAPRIFHVHGKDASVHRDVLGRFGAFGSERFAHHRFPGFGDSDWAAIFGELRQAGFRGSVDIEGHHDQSFPESLEMTAQVASFRHLVQARGGQFTPNPPEL